MGRPASVSNTGAAMQRMFFRCLSQHLYFTEATQAGHMTFCINNGQTGRVISAVFQTT